MGSQGIQWLVSEQNLYKFLSLCFLNNMDGVNLHHIRVLEASGFSFSKPPPPPTSPLNPLCPQSLEQTASLLWLLWTGVWSISRVLFRHWPTLWTSAFKITLCVFELSEKKKNEVYFYFPIWHFCSKLTSYHDCCVALANYSRCYALFLKLINKYQQKQVSASCI